MITEETMPLDLLLITNKLITHLTYIKIDTVN